MLLKHAALGAATLALCAAAGSAPASAQSMSCPDMYNQVMAVYRTAPLSPEYSQLAGAYSDRCLTGASAAPAYPGQAYRAPAPVYLAPSYGYAPAAYPDYRYNSSDGDGGPVGVGIGVGVGGGFHRDGFERGDRDDFDRHH
jgi:hypothetical protein